MPPQQATTPAAITGLHDEKITDTFEEEDLPATHTEEDGISLPCEWKTSEKCHQYCIVRCEKRPMGALSLLHNFPLALGSQTTHNGSSPSPPHLNADHHQKSIAHNQDEH
ncbi:uncharacterized protein FTOL_11948 [Fusarium torulosum]|uniref:Uncharacterized protein n=1 Tax=Fusarium torulosum TaxID=33205 RepID=A0AAE8MLC4_9HYPO|nr:uncharacterized protein FTOL_11948 [Fusarium torulosum]